MVEIPRQQKTVQEVFGARYPAPLEPLPPKEELGVSREQLSSELTAAITPAVVDAYERARAYTVVVNTALNKNPNTLFQVVAKEGVNSLHFSLYKNIPSQSPEIIAEFEFLQDAADNSWDFVHRFVYPQYREQGIFFSMLQAAENFIQIYADQCGQAQTIKCESARASSIFALSRQKGWEPSEGHQNRLSRILNGDPRLTCAHAYDPISLKSEELESLGDDPLVFEIPASGPFPEKPLVRDAYHVRLQKVIVPSKVQSETFDTQILALLREIALKVDQVNRTDSLHPLVFHQSDVAEAISKVMSEDMDPEDLEILLEQLLEADPKLPEGLSAPFHKIMESLRRSIEEV